ncbi:MAG: YafY family protein [Microbacteriaceae bacterium]
MPTPTSRVLQLLELLQSAEIRSVTELADRLGVNERTVRRYVRQLLELDVPVESVRGRYGGYRIAAGYRVPPLILSDEEAVAVFLGLSRAQAASESPDIAAQIALAKIRRSLPPASTGRLGALLEAAAGSPRLSDTPEAGILLTVSDAARERRPLELRYRDADETPSRRTVHPYDLAVRSSRWYLRALDVDRQEERIFRVDRIGGARALPGAFAAPPAAADALPPLVDRFVAANYRWRVLLRVRATEKQIRTHLPESVAVVQPLDDPGGGHAEEPWQRVEIHAKRLDWLPAVIAGLDGDVIIEAPDELREIVRATATRLLRIAEAAGTVYASGRVVYR